MTTEDKKLKKTKNKMLNDQITFDFFGGVLEKEIVTPKPKKEKKEKDITQINETKHICVKRNHKKKVRRIGKIRR